SVDRMRLAVAAQGQRVRFFLPPLQSAFRAVDFNEDVVLAAVRDLAGRDRAERSVLEANHRMTVVVQLATGFEGFQSATDTFRNQTGRVSSEIKRVRADVAEAARRTGTRRVGAP